MTQGVGTTFGSIIVAGTQYAQQFFCDPVSPGQCANVSSGGALKVDNSGVTQPVSASALPLPTGAATNSALTTINTTLGSPLQAGGTVVANAGTNLNTSSLALETGGNLAQIVTDFGAPGSTACTTDTASCNQNQQLQRLAQRLTSIVTALGSPFQAGGSIANTSFASTQSGIWTVQPGNTANTVPWLVSASQSGTWNVTNISGTVSLPTGASTSAKQPALGVAGTASTDVLTVQGVASMTPLLATLSGTNNINNISGTISLPTGAATSANQTGGGQKTQIVDGSGNVIASTSNNLNVQCANCSGAGASSTDEASFTAGASVLAPGGGFFQTTATSNPLTTGQQGMVQMTANRAFFTNLRNASGTEIGTAGTPLRVDPVGTTTQPISGTVTVNQSTASSLNATVVGTGTFVVQAAQSGAWTVNPTTAANWGIGSSTQNSASVANGSLVLGQFNTTPTTITSGNMSPFQLDNAGNLLVNIKAGAGSGGTALTDQAAFTQGTTSITPIGCLFIGSYSAITTGHAGVASCTNTGALNVQVTNTNVNGSAPSANSAPVVIASDQGAVATKAASAAFASGSLASGAVVDITNLSGATGSAVPAKASYTGAISSGNLTGIIQSDNSVAINVSTATTTQLVALTSAQKIYVTGYDVVAGGTGNITFEYGTGTACATGTTALTGAYPLTAQSGLTKGGGLGPVLVVPAGNALCVLTSAAVQMSGSVAYTKF